MALSRSQEFSTNRKRFMSILQLRTFTSKIGRAAVVLGIPALIGGLCLGNPVMMGAGCLTACLGAYAVAFGQVGAF